jgi:hypothetical protein
MRWHFAEEEANEAAEASGRVSFRKVRVVTNLLKNLEVVKSLKARVAEWRPKAYAVERLPWGLRGVRSLEDLRGMLTPEEWGSECMFCLRRLRCLRGVIGPITLTAAFITCRVLMTIRPTVWYPRLNRYKIIGRFVGGSLRKVLM